MKLFSSGSCLFQVLTLCSGVLVMSTTLAQDSSILDISGVSNDLYNPSGFAAVLRSEKAAVLSSQIDGLISDVYFSEGEVFEAGEKLLSIDCTLPLSEQKQNSAQYRFLKQEHKSNVELSKLDSISEMALAKSAVELEKALVEADKAKYKVERCDLAAPFSGNIVRWHVRQFENVQAKTELVEIVSNDALKIEFLLPSQYLDQLERDQKFEMFVVESDRSYTAEVVRIIPQVDSVSQRVKIIGKFSEITNELWSGMSGFVQFPVLTQQ